MKKLLLLFTLGLCLFSCNRMTDEFSPEDIINNEQAETLAKYKASFTEHFGEISPTQNWGFASLSKTTTRGAYTNSNMWESEGYVIPSEITPDELEKVLAVFSQPGEQTYESLIDWNTFFVQQVYKGDSVYVAHNGGSVVGSDHMDWLCAYDPVGYEEVIYPAYNNYLPTVIVNHDDHINDFNYGNCIDNNGVMLMVNSSTSRFGFKASEDNGHVFYNFRMEEIDGNYYVGFDFEANGANPNEQVDRDLVYDDWIVKIVPGKGYTDKVKEQGMIICEDLGNIGDFDFNDVVFFAKVWESGKCEITLYAAGGTLDLSVAGVDVHEAFGQGKNENGTWKMVNTGAGPTAEPYYFVANGKYEHLIDIPVIVRKTTSAGLVNTYELTTVLGGAPQKICVPVGFKWVKEYKPLYLAYPHFKNWTTGDADTWTGNIVPEYIYNW